MKVSIINGDQFRAAGDDVASDLPLALLPEFHIAARYRTKKSAFFCGSKTSR